MNVTRWITAGSAGLLASTALSPAARAQSSDALLDKLVEKGILSNKEAEELREEADKNFTTAYQVKSGMPDWVEALKFSGDFRGRFEGFYSDATYSGTVGTNSVAGAFVDRTRWRYRLRFGATAVLKNGFEIGLRLGSGDIDAYPASGIDPISNNQSLQNNGSKKGIFIDLAYAKWMALNNADVNAVLTLGKMENPFVFSDLVFDGDYTPEGVALQTSFFLTEQQTLRFNGGGFILDEIGGSSNDPYLGAAQLRLDSTWSPKIATSAGASILSIGNPNNLANTSVPNINRGNSRLPGAGALAYDFYPVVADLSLTYTLEHFPFYNGAFPIRVGGEYMYNFGAEDAPENDAFAVGFVLGKSGKKGTWDLSYTYKWLGSDAWWEEMVDSDTGAFWGPEPNPPQPGRSQFNYSGGSNGAIGYFAGTNVRGHVARLAYSPLDFLTLSIKGFFTELIDTFPDNADSQMARVQADAIWKF